MGDTDVLVNQMDISVVARRGAAGLMAQPSCIIAHADRSGAGTRLSSMVRGLRLFRKKLNDKLDAAGFPVQSQRNSLLRPLGVFVANLTRWRVAGVEEAMLAFHFGHR